MISLKNKRFIDVDYRHCLIGSIKGFAEESRLVRSKIRSCKSDSQKDGLAESRNFIGNRTRHYLLAYAFLRNLPYNVIEKKCRKDNTSNAKLIHDIVSMHTYSMFQKKEIYSLNSIENWLKGE